MMLIEEGADEKNSYRSKTSKKNHANQGQYRHNNEGSNKQKDDASAHATKSQLSKYSHDRPKGPSLRESCKSKILTFYKEVARGGSVRGFLALSNQVIEEIEVRQETKKQEDFMRKTTLKAGFMTRSTLKDAERHKS
jgi:hypothetical protein